jgi:hypothetical protein
MSLLKYDLNSIKLKLEKIEANLNKQSNQINEREEKWEMMEQNVKNFKLNNSRKVTLNIGGEVFVTCINTLFKIPNTLFQQIIDSDRLNLEEEIYIERSGFLFKILLKYMRYQEFNYKHYDKETLLDIKEEALFFGIDPLYEQILDLTKDIEFVKMEHSGNYTYKEKTAGTQLLEDLKTKDLLTGVCCKSPGFIIVELNGNWEFEEIEIAGFNGNSKLWYPGNGSGSKIYTSQDKKEWTLVGTVSSSYATKIVTCKLKKSQARYIKFENKSYVGIGHLFVKRVTLV